jgi:hypothetical protein
VMLADSMDTRRGAKTDRANSTLCMLAEYILQLRNSANGQQDEVLPPGTKKRKLGGGDGAALPEVRGTVLFSGPDTSFSIPVRKKLKLEGLNGGLRGVDPTGNAEMSIGWDSIGIFHFPVSEFDTERRARRANLVFRTRFLSACSRQGQATAQLRGYSQAT